MTSRSEKSAVVLMSGGVDSSVAAYLLKKEGWKVHALFLEMLDENHIRQSREAAKEIASLLEIDFFIKEVKREFKEQIIKYFVNQYLDGVTPNPCVICNPTIKIKYGLEACKEIGANCMATGHYARILQEGEKGFGLYKAMFPEKDQSYFLHQIPRPWLTRILFPLGNLKKREVVKIAEEAGFGHIAASESQEICFIKDDYRSFLESQAIQIPSSGPIVDQRGNPLGTHKGLHSYTIGQRRGLGIPDATPYYVTGIDFKKNILTVGKKEDLYSHTLKIDRINLLVDKEELLHNKCMVKIRSRHPGALAEVRFLDEDMFQVTFDEPQKSITPGQFAVFYRESKVLGGGRICA